MSRILSELQESPQKSWMLISLLLFLCFPAVGLIQKHLGLIGIVVYILVILVALLALIRFRTTLYDFVEKRFIIIAILAAVGLVAIFAIVYPMETSGRFGLGSDRDEALDIAVRSIAAGQYPYHERTPLGGAIMQLPGAILLSAPFVALGSSAYQNIFWLFVFAFVTVTLFKNRAAALLLLVTPLLLSPALQYEFISGGDLLANGIYVVVFLFLVVRTFSKSDSLPWLRILTCIALGIALASRFYFLILIPLLFVVLLRTSNMRSALIGTGVTVLTSCAVILPYYLFAPKAFTPVAASTLASLDTVIPYAGVVVIVITSLLSIVGAVMLSGIPKRDLIPYLYWMGAVVLFLSMLSVVVFNSLANGHLDLSYIYHRDGLMFLLLGLWGCWPYLYGVPKSADANSGA
jgi:hypothetical protein